MPAPNHNESVDEVLSYNIRFNFCSFPSADNWSIQQEREKKHLEDELRELRSQVGRSAAVVGDYSSLQKDLERSEKQRAQLSDHIQVSRLRHSIL